VFVRQITPRPPWLAGGQTKVPKRTKHGVTVAVKRFGEVPSLAFGAYDPTIELPIRAKLPQRHTVQA